ncbi:MAG: hypothetical protein MHM6MM_001672 [Cercozoa sp. M6MM]
MSLDVTDASWYYAYDASSPCRGFSKSMPCVYHICDTGNAYTPTAAHGSHAALAQWRAVDSNKNQSSHGMRNDVQALFKKTVLHSTRVLGTFAQRVIGAVAPSVLNMQGGSELPPVVQEDSSNHIRQQANAKPDAVSSGTGISTALHLIDFAGETTAQIGRQWTNADIDRGDFERTSINRVLPVQMHTRVAEKLDLNVGDIFVYALDLSSQDWPFLHTLLLRAAEAQKLAKNETKEHVDSLKSKRTWALPMRIATIRNDGKGKFPSDSDDWIAADIDEFKQVALHFSNVRAHAVASNSAALYNLVALPDMREASTHLHASFLRASGSKDFEQQRFKLYHSSSYEDIRKKMQQRVSKLLFSSGGFVAFQSDLPVLDELRRDRLLALLLGLALNILLVVLIALSVALLQSLLLISVQSRRFQFGVLRMLGMRRRRVVGLLLVQSMVLSLPSTVLAVILAALLNAGIASVLRGSLSLDDTSAISSLLPAGAVLLGLALGILVPLISLIVPLRAALRVNVQDAVDMRRSASLSNKALRRVRIARVEDTNKQVSPALLALGGATFLAGFVVYYLVPLSLLSADLVLFFNIVLFILAGMLIALVSLSLRVALPLLQSLLVTLLFFWEPLAMRVLLKKQLLAHREHNRRTSLMFAVSLGFVVFAAASFQLQTSLASFATLKAAGGYINVRVTDAQRTQAMSLQSIADIERLSTGTSPTVESLQASPWVDLSRDLSVSVSDVGIDASVPFDDVVQEIGWRTMPLGAVDAVRTRVVHPGRAFAGAVDIFGVTANFFRAAGDGDSDGFLRLRETAPGVNRGNLGDRLNVPPQTETKKSQSLRQSVSQSRDSSFPVLPCLLPTAVLNRLRIPHDSVVKGKADFLLEMTPEEITLDDNDNGDNGDLVIDPVTVNETLTVNNELRPGSPRYVHMRAIATADSLPSMAASRFPNLGGDDASVSVTAEANDRGEEGDTGVAALVVGLESYRLLRAFGQITAVESDSGQEMAARVGQRGGGVDLTRAARLSLSPNERAAEPLPWARGVIKLTDSMYGAVESGVAASTPQAQRHDLYLTALRALAPIARPTSYLVTSSDVVRQDTGTPTLKAADFLNTQRSNNDTLRSLGAVFAFAALVALSLCVAALLAAAAASTRAQAKELGVVRALGLTLSQLRRVLAEEAAVVVVSASMMGLLIGVLLATAMALQQALFADAPLQVAVPVPLVLVSVAIALLTAVLAALGYYTA